MASSSRQATSPRALPTWVARYRRALQQLPPAWEEKAVAEEALNQLEETLGRLAQTATTSAPALAVIGPKNAGKSFILRGLLPEATAQTLPDDLLQVGWRADQATRRITWLGHEAPPTFDPREESFYETPPLDRLFPGQAVLLGDVPGFNERHEAEQTAADRILSASAIKLLVLPASLIETREWIEYVHACRGGWVFPIINGVRGEEQEDLMPSMHRRLCEALGHDRVAAPFIFPDLDITHPDDKASQAARLFRELARGLRETFAQLDADDLWYPEFEGRLQDFRKRWGRWWKEKLPLTRESLGEFRNLEATFPDLLTEILFPAPAQPDPHLVLALKSRFWQNTPGVFFPFKAFLGLAHLLHGALQKVPFLFMGSFPAAFGSLWQALRNNQAQEAWQARLRDPEKSRAEGELEARCQPLVQKLRQAMAEDLEQSERRLFPAGEDGPALLIRIEGLDTLHQRHSAALESVIQESAPGRMAAWVVGLGGMGIFWGIFLWPLVTLYVDYFAAAGTMLHANGGPAWSAFPSGAGSVLGTAFLLALFPLFLWIALSESWLFRAARLSRVQERLRTRQQKLTESGRREGTLRIHWQEPMANSLETLLTLDSGG